MELINTLQEQRQLKKDENFKNTMLNMSSNNVFSLQSQEIQKSREASNSAKSVSQVNLHKLATFVKMQTQRKG